MTGRAIVGVLAAAGVALCAGWASSQAAGGVQPGGGEAAVQPVEIDAAELPSAAEVFSSYLEAVGGEDAVRAVASRKFSGRVRIFQQGDPTPRQEGRIEMIAAPPAMLVQEIIFPGQTSSTTYVKDGVVWQVDEQDRARQITGETAARQITSAGFYQLADWETMFESVEVVGGVEQGDRKAVRVRATHKDGRVEDYVFDLDSGLLLAVMGQRASPVNPSQQVPFQRVYENYEETDGVRYARRVLEQAGPIVFEIEVSSIETGIDVPEIEVPDFEADAVGE